MSGCILHYGMHKTGSSSIQDSLHAALADPRFHYLDLGRPNASAEVLTAFSATPERQNMNRKLGLDRAQLLPRAAALRRRLEEELDRARGRTALISGEHIPLLQPAELSAFADFVRAGADSLRAVGYVRDPQGYIESVFQQRVKGGRGEFAVEASFPRYRARFGRLEAALGAERVAYWVYDPARFPQGCVVRDFCARLGIALDGSAIRRSNEALSLPALRLLYAYRKLGPGYGSGARAVRENFALIRLLTRLAGPKLRFDAALTAPVIAAHREEIEWMSERLGEPILRPAGDGGGIREEAQLLRFEAPEREWLAEQIGQRVVKCDDDAPAIAQQMQRLRECAPRIVEGAQPGGLATRVRRALRRLGG
jgi:hypothetical protein